MSSTKETVVGILRAHVASVIPTKRNGRIFYDAACKACEAPLPWGEDARGRALIAHQGELISAELERRVAPVRALAERLDALAEISEHDRAYVLCCVVDDLQAALPS